MLKDIAKAGYSHAYLQNILITPLSCGGLYQHLWSVGGVCWTKHAKYINLKEIVEILEGATNPVECLVNAKICPRSRLCAY